MPTLSLGKFIFFLHVNFPFLINLLIFSRRQPILINLLFAPPIICKKTFRSLGHFNLDNSYTVFSTSYYL